MKIAVVGAGAMGAIFGARFVQGGHDTVLVDVAAPLVERINADGVTIVRGDEETVTRVPATGDPAAVGPVDLVVFCVKCYHTESAAELARPLVGSETVVASLQNGWGNGDVLARAYAAEQLVVGVTYNSGTVLDTGRVAHPGVGPTTIGSFTDGAADGADRLAQALSDGGLEVVIAAPIRPEIWKKLILNAASLPTAALTGLTAGALTGHEGMHELVTDDGARSGRGRPSPRLRHRRGGTGGVHPQALAERRPDQGVDAPGRRGRPPHRDRRDQRRGGARRPTRSASRCRSTGPSCALVHGWEARRGLS